jgi:DNA-binding PadR family transcriptional regulator
MTISRANLTELEGAILGVLRRDPSCTAYRIRQVFLASRSAEWSGSAGAVYPALRRMHGNGLLAEQPVRDERGTRKYCLTPIGRTAHDLWLCDEDRAIGYGLDPFRTRAGLWSLLPASKWVKLLKVLKRVIERRRGELLQELPSLDQGDMNMTSLYLAVQDVRLNWIEQRLMEQVSK